MRRALCIAVVASTVAGCASPFRILPASFLDQHAILKKDDADLLDGPYEMVKALTPTSILIKQNGDLVTVRMRGCNATVNAELNFRALKLLGTLNSIGPDDVYLRSDCTVMVDSNILSAVVYRPAVQVFHGEDSNGTMLYDNQSYVMRQISQLLYGYCTLDRTDTDYSLYDVFAEAERLARESGRGTWEKGSQQSNQ